ncbi:hypothetical protein SDC9_89357 [bioreactor metagenome]|uniref:Uncharacterized protein n=1 Tax=bioreactor metagenome TaxID=1076179 RepID=A0A644ZQN7_9ZZZZ
MPLFQKCADALFEIGVAGHVAGIGDLQLVFAVHLEILLLVHAGLQIPQHQRPAPAQLPRLCLGGGHQFLQCVHHHGDAAVFVVKLLCGDKAAAVAHIPLDLGRQDAGQVPAAAHHAELRFRRAEEGVLYGDGDVRPGGIAQAAAKAVPVNRADQGHPQVVQRLGPVVIDLLRVGHVLVQNALVKALNVHAHAEGL